jgi:hypothetical protein
MPPSRQRLKSPDFAGRDIDDRLEVDVNCVIGDRRPELKLDQPANLDLSVHRLLEGPPSAPAVRFRRVQRNVCAGQQRLGTNAIRRRGRAADTGADDDLAPVDDDRLADLFDNALG